MTIHAASGMQTHQRKRGRRNLPLPSAAAKRARVQASALDQFRITQCRGGGPGKRLPIRMEALKQESGCYDETQGSQAEPQR